jgi:protein-tyrosine phosphatase
MSCSSGAGFADLHSHVLPGIDDGAPDLAESLAMLRAASAAGTTTIAATPHLHADFPFVHVEQLADRCAQLRAAIAGEGIDIRLVSGAETSLIWALEASDEELRLASYGRRGTDLLIETPSQGVAGLDTLLYQLRVKGLRVTLAHPERSPEFQRDPSQLADLVQQGVLLQVNASALLRGSRSAPDARLARRLCVDGLTHALASDGHRAATWRPVDALAAAEHAARAIVGPERARWLTHDAPAAILAGAQLPTPPARTATPLLSKLIRRPGHARV